MSGTTNSSYELRAPRRSRSGISADAWAPSQLELLTQQQIAQTDGSQLLGYQLNARSRQQRAADEYAALANAVSQRQTESDNLEARLGAAARIADARNPELAVAFTDVRNMIDPRFQETMDQLPQILPARQTATANYDNARANQANTEAGIVPPQGSQVDRYGLPLEPRSVTTPLDLRVAQANAAGRANGDRAASLTALTGMVNTFANREQFIATQQAAAEARLLGQIGVRADASGQIVVPPGVTQQQIDAARARARAEAIEAVDRSLAAAGHIYTAGGYGRLLPPAIPRAPVTQPGPAIVPTGPAVPQVTGPGPRAGGTTTPTAAPAQPQRVAPNAVSPDRMAQINAVAPPQPGTRRVLVGNEVVYIDNAGAVQRRVPVQ